MNEMASLTLDAGTGKAESWTTSGTAVVLRRLMAPLFLLSSVAFLYMYGSTFLPYSSSSSSSSSSWRDFIFQKQAPALGPGLRSILEDAATNDKTVIITTLNEAWAAPDSVFDLFLQSFKMGNDTSSLLNHLVVVAMDRKAFTRCSLLHKHCFALVTNDTHFSQEADFMTPDYLKMMWTRIHFLRRILQMGYSFVFTDTDIMWFRNPFSRFYPDADFQIACDYFSGNSSDLDNNPNGGFTYVRSTNRSVAFYEFWLSSQHRFPGFHDQDVLNFIKHDPLISEMGVKIRFLDTAYFGGLCQPSRDLNVVRTMHANCCIGMERKVADLGIMLQDWRDYMALTPLLKTTTQHHWSVPKNCSLAPLHHSKHNLR